MAQPINYDHCTSSMTPVWHISFLLLLILLSLYFFEVQNATSVFSNISKRLLQMPNPRRFPSQKYIFLQNFLNRQTFVNISEYIQPVTRSRFFFNFCAGRNLISLDKSWCIKAMPNTHSQIWLTLKLKNPHASKLPRNCKNECRRISSQ